MLDVWLMVGCQELYFPKSVRLLRDAIKVMRATVLQRPVVTFGCSLTPCNMHRSPQRQQLTSIWS